MKDFLALNLTYSNIKLHKGKFVEEDVKNLVDIFKKFFRNSFEHYFSNVFLSFFKMLFLRKCHKFYD